MSARGIWEDLVVGGWAALEQWKLDGRTESVHLDFKSAALDKGKVREEDQKNLAKGLSAFGNTEGGVLIFGASTTTGVDKVDRLTDLPGVFPLGTYAERLRALIANITSPTIPGVATMTFDKPGTTDCGVVAVYVPLTDALPFRAEGPSAVSGRYFIRSTTDATVMPHQVLAAMFGRRPQPKFRVGLKLDGHDQIWVSIENVGRGTAVMPMFRLRIDRRGGTENIGLGSQLGSPWRDHHSDVIHDSEVQWDIVALLPNDYRIYPGERRHVAICKFATRNPIVQVRIDSENAQPFEAVDAAALKVHEYAWVPGSTT